MFDKNFLQLLVEGGDGRREMRVGKRWEKKNAEFGKELSPRIGRLDSGIRYIRGNIEALPIMSCGEKRIEIEKKIEIHLW